MWYGQAVAADSYPVLTTVMSGRKATVPGTIKRLTPGQLDALVTLNSKSSDHVPDENRRDNYRRIVAYGYATESARGYGERTKFTITTQGRWRLLDPKRLLAA